MAETPEPKPEPNVNGILELIGHNGKIEKAEKKQQDGMSELGKIYQTIEKDMAGCRPAVSLIRRMQKMSDEKRGDFIRTLEPLMVRLGYTLDDIEPDLVDQSRKQAQTDGDGDGDDGEGQGDESDAQPPKAGRNSPVNNLENARAHLSGGAMTEDQANDVVRSIKGAAGRAKLGIASPTPDTEK